MIPDPIRRRCRRSSAALLAIVAAAAGPLAGVEIGIDGASFTLDGKPAFLIGISYYGALGAPRAAIVKDLDELAALGFNWIRVWATWAAYENDVAAVDRDGRSRQPYFDTLLWLIGEADRRGIVVDVTLSRGNGAVAGDPLLPGPEAHLRAVETLARALRQHRNVYLDVANERNIGDPRHVGFEELRALRERIKAIDPGRLVTASHGGDLDRDDVRRYLVEGGFDFLAPHRPRGEGSPAATAAATREVLAWMKDLGRAAPLHYQEPFRRGYAGWEPHAGDFLLDAIESRRAGAAGWCLHNGGTRGRADGPRRSFDMRHSRLFEQLDAHERHVARRLAFLLSASTRTWVDVVDGRWRLDGRITYPGAPAEGLLMNARMVNATFDDRNASTRPAGFDADSNLAEFLAALPDYAAHGIRAFTLCLQGGMPNYEGALNSGFAPDGALRPEALECIERAIRAADAAGAAVILGCFYQRQDQHLVDEAALRAGVRNASRWIRERGFANVLLEIANEYPHAGFDHALLRSPAGQAEFIRIAQEAAPGLLVSTSGVGDGGADREVVDAADFILIHFNGVPVARIPALVESLKKSGKAVVCNEDDKAGAEGARAAEASVRAGCSWGLMLKEINQFAPFTFRGAADDPVIYGRLKELTSPPRGG